MTGPNVLSAQRVPRALAMSDRESPLHPDEAQFARVQIEFAISQDFFRRVGEY